MNWFEKLQSNYSVTVSKLKTYRGGEFGDKGGFDATFVLNGKQIAQVSDNNSGGPLNINATPEYFDLAAKYVEDHNKDEYEKGSSFAYHLVGAYETMQALKRKCKTKIQAINEQCSEGQYISFKVAYTIPCAT
jgi:hypothetical protein